MDLKEIRQIVELMKRNDLSLFHLEREGFKIKLRRGVDFDGVSGHGSAPATPGAVGAPPAAKPIFAQFEHNRIKTKPAVPVDET